jgi:hypothetical protein
LHRSPPVMVPLTLPALADVILSIAGSPLIVASQLLTGRLNGGGGEHIAIPVRGPGGQNEALTVGSRLPDAVSAATKVKITMYL